MLACTGQQASGQSDTAEHPSHAALQRSDGPTDAEAAAFVAAARAGTARYHDLRAAISDGYRRLGGELPGMGEHWLHNGRALADTIVAQSPPILIYARVGGRPRLAGVAYTRFLPSGFQFPDFPRGVAHAWHDHNGSVAEEVLPLGHAPSARPTRADRRVGVMHAWVWIPNPEGLWAADNWALPYLRLGLTPLAAGARAARALSLASGGDAYYVGAISRAGLSDDETESVRAIVSRRRAQATELASRLARLQVEGNAPLVDSTTAALARLWTSMWHEISTATSAEVSARLAPLRDAVR